MNLVRNRALGVYISIPFCRSKCTYCNFASGVYPASKHGHYVNRLVQDLEQSGAWARSMAVDLPRQVDSVYLGGGTPSLLAPKLVTQLFGALHSELDLDPDAEITVECAPSQLADETLEALVAAGVNRVSLGVQSFIDSEAKVSGRHHTRAIVLDDIRRLRAAGIPNLNLDLIAGLAGQTFASWEESLSVLIDAGAPHASVYMLEVDEDSRLGREMLSGGARYHAALVPADDAIARMYEVAIEKLEQAGLLQYEISNFSHPGSESSHNLPIGSGVPTSALASTPPPCSAKHCNLKMPPPKPPSCVPPSPTIWPITWPMNRSLRPPGSRPVSSTRRPGSSACASTPESM
jgi:oxygen-independent coproporphyrinogen-3 oxidase